MHKFRLQKELLGPMSGLNHLFSVEVLKICRQQELSGMTGTSRH